MARSMRSPCQKPPEKPTSTRGGDSAPGPERGICKLKANSGPDSVVANTKAQEHLIKTTGANPTKIDAVHISLVQKTKANQYRHLSDPDEMQTAIAGVTAPDEIMQR